MTNLNFWTFILFKLKKKQGRFKVLNTVKTILLKYALEMEKTFQKISSANKGVYCQKRKFRYLCIPIQVFTVIEVY